MNKIFFSSMLMLLCISIALRAQEQIKETSEIKKNAIYFEYGYPFGFSENESIDFLITPNVFRNNVYSLEINYIRHIDKNLNVNLGLKEKCVNNAISTWHYTGAWKSRTVYLGVGYNIHLIKNLQLIPAINLGYSNVLYVPSRESFTYDGQEYVILWNNFTPKYFSSNAFYLNAQVGIDYTLLNRIHIKLSFDYDNCFIRNLKTYHPDFVSQDRDINFNSFSVKLGAGFSF